LFGATLVIERKLIDAVTVGTAIPNDEQTRICGFQTGICIERPIVFAFRACCIRAILFINRFPFVAGTGRRGRRRWWFRTIGCSYTSRVTSCIGNPTNIIVLCNQNVSLVSPSRPPTVFNFVVITAWAHGTIPDGQHPVVKFVATRFVVKDTGRVKLERRFIGFNRNRYRTEGNGGFQLCLIAFGHIDVPRQGDSRFARVPTGLTDRCVGICGIQTNTTVGFDPSIGIVHCTTVATIITPIVVTIHQLLLGQGIQRATCDLVSSLKRPSCRERPTRATLTLVFYRCDRSLGRPIDGRRDISVGYFMDIGATMVKVGVFVLVTNVGVVKILGC
jgi:hypothetical protein